MVQRKGKAMYGFATNKTVRKFNLAKARNYENTVYEYIAENQVYLEENKEVISEDLKQAKKEGRKRMLKTSPKEEEELYPRETISNDPVEKEFQRKHVQGVHVDQNGKQKVIFKYKAQASKRIKENKNDRVLNKKAILDF